MTHVMTVVFWLALAVMVFGIGLACWVLWSMSNARGWHAGRMERDREEAARRMYVARRAQLGDQGYVEPPAPWARRRRVSGER